MHEVISKHKLLSDEGMSTLRVLGPDIEYKDAIISLIEHKGPLWVTPIEEAMDGKITVLKTYCYLALLADEVVGNITTVEALEEPVGILQHVYTRPEHRRKGIATYLMQGLLDDFKARKGRALYLGTGYGSGAHRIYLRRGFHDLGQRTGYMRFLSDEDFDAKYFGGSEVEVSPANWQHWPGVNALFSIENGWYMRSVTSRKFGVSGFEGDFISVMLEQREGRVRDAKVLISEGAVVGLAFLKPDPRWNYGVTVLDFFVHPRFLDSGAKLIGALDFGEEKTQSYVESSEKSKSQILQDSGFKLEAKLKEQLKHPQGLLDILLYSRNL